MQDRYRAVVFGQTLPSGDHVFSLKEEIRGSKRVIVSKQQVAVQDIKNCNEVFLKTRTQAGNWHASAWPRTGNPWLTKRLPMTSHEVEGTVDRRINEQSMTVDVEWDGYVLECTIYSDFLPPLNRSSPIEKVLFPGDRVRGVVRTVDQQSLQIVLDINAWLERQVSRWKSSHQRVAQKYSRNSGIGTAEIALAETSLDLSEQIEQKNRFSALTGKTFVIIDDDFEFSQLLGKRLDQADAEVRLVTSDKSASMRERTYATLREVPDIIILDFQLGQSADDNNEIRSTVKAALERKPSSKCLLISGDLENAHAYASQNGYGFLSKPVNIAAINRWMENPQSADGVRNIVDKVAHRLFAVESRTKAIIDKACVLLTDSCRRYDFLGALWFVEIGEGRFELRAHSDSLKLATGKLPENLARSVVSNAVVGKDQLLGRLSDNDPVAALVARTFPSENVHYLSHPIIENHRSHRCIIFFSSRAISRAVAARVSARDDHFRLLIDAIDQSEGIDEISSAAERGRLALSSLHEIRRDVGMMMLALEDDARTAEAKCALAQQHLVSIKALSEMQLRGYTHDERSFRIADLVEAVCTKMADYLKDERDTIVDLDLTIDPAISGLRLSLNERSVERTLVNLIDNAAVFVQIARVQKIWVHAMRVEYDMEGLPIHISVRDSGPGVSVNDQRRLFQPRGTTRTEDGTGLGLYMSRSLIEAVGGKLDLVSRPRWAGAEFVIRLPEMIG